VRRKEREKEKKEKKRDKKEKVCACAIIASYLHLRHSEKIKPSIFLVALGQVWYHYRSQVRLPHCYLSIRGCDAVPHSIFSKSQEFHTWLVEERKINPETISKDQSKRAFAKFVEDFNTGAPFLSPCSRKSG
jgi:hypothetical protein